MAHKVTIHDVVAVAREVEIPEVCPKCQTPLHDEEEHPLREWEFNDVQHVVRFEGADSDEIDYFCDDDGGECYITLAYYCQCGHCFTEGTTVTLSQDNPRGARIRDVIALEE